MILIYGECQKNQMQTATLYAQRFPDRRHPNHSFFHSHCERLKTNGAFYKSTRPIHVPQREQEAVDALRQAFMTILIQAQEQLPQI